MRKNWKTYLRISAAIAGICGIAALAAPAAAPATAAEGPAKYKYDPNWPKPLPNNWAIGGITGMFVDHEDHIWVLNRPRDLDDTNNYATLNPPAAECCVSAPAVLEFDAEGNLLRSWGKPDMVPGWPKSEHTIFVDRQKNVYIAGAQAGDTILKFTVDGKFISEFGHRGPAIPANQQKQNNQQTDLLLRGVAAATIDEAANEIYIADGYLNKRVMVYDWGTGAFKRGWGAYGKPLAEISNEGYPVVGKEGEPGAKDFKSPVHCVRISKDGLVYVCDRGGNRVQVFTKDGKYLKEFYMARNTLMRGTAGSVDFSPDADQKYVFVADIMNMTVWQMDRQSGQVVQRIGRPGHEGGAFSFLHVATMDSKGNLYTGEVATGRRVQKFSPGN
jgi:DNA-binding beta-propeller fold protein YncE